MGEIQEGKALLYLIRPKARFASWRTTFVFLDKAFLTSIDPDCYSFVEVNPGEHLLWASIAGTTPPGIEISLRAGDQVFFIQNLASSGKLLPTDEEYAKSLIEDIGFFCISSEEETVTANRKVDKWHRDMELAREGSVYGSAQKHAERVAKWPELDLSEYDVIYIEDAVLLDPKKDQRWRSEQVRTFPRRIADMVAINILKTNITEPLFAEIHRGRLHTPRSKTLVLRMEVTRYKPGWNVGLTFRCLILDGESEAELVEISGRGSGSPEFPMSQVETNVAYDIALYVKQSAR